MTEAELKVEHAYLVQERIGILCADQPPTLEQLRMAKKEADEAVEELRKQSE